MTLNILHTLIFNGYYLFQLVLNFIYYIYVSNFFFWWDGGNTNLYSPIVRQLLPHIIKIILINFGSL